MAKAKFDIKTEATRPFYAGVGVTDLAVEAVRDYVADFQAKFADVQKNVITFDYTPQNLRDQAVTVVGARVEALSKDAKARQAAVEARVAELQAEVQTLVTENVATANDTYVDLAKRGEVLVGRIRNQEATKATVKSANTTTAKAKTTKTQANKAASTTVTGAKKTANAAKTTAVKTAAPAKTAAAKKTTTATGSAKATTTAAQNTAANAVDAAADAAKKVGN